MKKHILISLLFLIVLQGYASPPLRFAALSKNLFVKALEEWTVWPSDELISIDFENNKVDVITGKRVMSWELIEASRMITAEDHTRFIYLALTPDKTTDAEVVIYWSNPPEDRLYMILFALEGSWLLYHLGEML